ncbi:unnamed protein product, partial [Ectocarpus fasciculatus]
SPGPQGFSGEARERGGGGRDRGAGSEFVDESLLKQEYDKDEAEAGWGGAAAVGDGGGRHLYSLQTEKRMFPASETSASTTGAGFGGPAAMSAAAAAAAAAAGGGGNGKGVPGALLAAHNSAAAAKAAAAERRGFVGDEQKRKRFDEFILGFLSMSLFQAADIWLPLSSRNGGGRDGGPSAEAAAGGKGNKKVSRLFVYSSKVQDPALAKWSSLSRNVVLASGVGLPGIVFRERRPQWAVDYSQVDSERNPLASVARLLGIGSAFGVPLSLGADDECGVLMLYSMSCLPPSELMVEFMERSTRLLLDDGPAPITVVQQFRDNPPSAKDIGRVAGAYQQHALWAEHHVRSNSINGSSNGVGVGGTRRSGGGGVPGSLAANLLSQDGSGGFGSGDLGGGGDGRGSSDNNNNSNGRSSPLMAALSECVAADWSGDRAALAVAAVAAASGGQGGGFRPDGGAVAFVPPPPRDRSGSKAASPARFLFNRIDLDSRPPVAENNVGVGPPVPPPPPPRLAARRGALTPRTVGPRSAGTTGAPRGSANTRAATSCPRGTPGCASRTAAGGAAPTRAATREPATASSARRTAGARGARCPSAARPPSGVRTCARG